MSEKENWFDWREDPSIKENVELILGSRESSVSNINRTFLFGYNIPFFIFVFLVIHVTKLFTEKIFDTKKITPFILNFIISIYVFCLICAFFDKSILINTDVYDYRTIDNFGSELTWIRKVKLMQNCFTWIFVPVIALYIYEIIAYPKINFWILIHHLSVILTSIIGYRGLFETLDVHYFRMGIVSYLHIAFEPPIFACLIYYRLYRNRTKTLVNIFKYVNIYQAILRITINILMLYSLATFYRNKQVLYSYDYFWSFYFILFCIQNCIIQFIIFNGFLHIHNRLKKRLSSGKNSNVSSNTHHVNRTDVSRQESNKHFLAKKIIIIIIMLFYLCMTSLIFVFDMFGSDVHTIKNKESPIAIIGGGISGMAAAWSLSLNGFNVTIFDKNDYLGGAAKTFYHNKKVYDVGFKSFKKYYIFEELLSMLSIRKDEKPSSYTSRLNDKLYGNALPYGFHNEIKKYEMEIKRFRKSLFDSAYTMPENKFMTMHLEDFLDQKNFSEEFRTNILKQCLSVYVGTGSSGLDTSLGVVYFFEKRFGGCTSLYSSSHYNVHNGTSSYVFEFENILRNNGVNIKLNTNIESINFGRNGKINLKFDNKYISFDNVILSNPIRNSYLLEDMSNQDDVLMSFNNIIKSSKKVRVSTICINKNVNNNFMEIFENRQDKCIKIEAYNFISENDGTTYSMTPDNFIGGVSQCIPSSYFKNDMCFYIDEYNIDKFLSKYVYSKNDTEIIKRFDWEHLFHNKEFVNIGRNVHKFQGYKNLWYIGSDITLNLHEQAMASGLVIAERLGGGTAPLFNNSKALKSFLATKFHMLYGLNTIYRV